MWVETRLGSALVSPSDGRHGQQAPTRSPRLERDDGSRKGQQLAVVGRWALRPLRDPAVPPLPPARIEEPAGGTAVPPCRWRVAGERWSRGRISEARLWCADATETTRMPGAVSPGPVSRAVESQPLAVILGSVSRIGSPPGLPTEPPFTTQAWGGGSAARVVRARCTARSRSLRGACVRANSSTTFAPRACPSDSAAYNSQRPECAPAPRGRPRAGWNRGDGNMRKNHLAPYPHSR